MSDVFWSNHPEPRDVEKNYRFLKHQGTGALRVRILSHDVAVTKLHYWRNRSTPHRGDKCHACKAGNQWRWTGFMFVCELDQRQPKILQVTGAVAARLHVEFTHLRTLKNLCIELTRKDKRANAELQIKIGRQHDDWDWQPKMPEIEPILLRTWEVNEAKQLLTIHNPEPLSATGTDDITTHD